MCLSRLFNPYHCSSSPTFSELDRRFANMDDQVLDSEENKNANKARNVKNSDDLLEQVFPKHVAEALKAGKKVRLMSQEIVLGILELTSSAAVG